MAIEEKTSNSTETQFIGRFLENFGENIISGVDRRINSFADNPALETAKLVIGYNMLKAYELWERESSSQTLLRLADYFYRAF